jgi:hypothetical protein
MANSDSVTSCAAPDRRRSARTATTIAVTALDENSPTLGLETLVRRDRDDVAGLLHHHDRTADVRLGQSNGSPNPLRWALRSNRFQRFVDDGTIGRLRL